MLNFLIPCWTRTLCLLGLAVFNGGYVEMLSIALLFVYSGLSILHLIGLGLNSAVLLDVEVNMVKMTQILLSFTFILPLFVADLLTLCFLSESSSVDFRDTIDYMDVFAAFTFICVFVHVNSIKLLTTLKSIAKDFYSGSLQFLIGKLLFGIFSFFVGLVLCDLSNSDYIPFFTVLYFCVTSLGNLLFFTLARNKMSYLRSGGSPSYASTSGWRVSVLTTKSHGVKSAVVAPESVTQNVKD